MLKESFVSTIFSSEIGMNIEVHKKPQRSGGVALRDLLQARHFFVIICYVPKIYMNLTFYYTKYSSLFNVRIKFLPHTYYPRFSS